MSNDQNNTRKHGQTCPDGIAPETFRQLLEVGAAPISDALDKRGKHDQVLDPGFFPIVDEMVVVGVARTLVSAPHSGPIDEGREYELLIEALDDLNPGDVMVTDRMDCCVWGELCSERSAAKGSNGALIDGYHRDTRLILESGFPVISRGRHVADLLYKRSIVARDKPVECGGVTVAPGDVIVADLDGVVIVPADIVGPVAADAYAKASSESEMREALRSGASVREVWETYKIL